MFAGSLWVGTAVLWCDRRALMCDPAISLTSRPACHIAISLDRRSVVRARVAVVFQSLAHLLTEEGESRRDKTVAVFVGARDSVRECDKATSNASMHRFQGIKQTSDRRESMTSD
jgi:hypothetical protein